ncbi:MAG: hypothetical protein KZQ93_09950 [Candidatus Thiodiazotropha sp. (ex Monitilora ramsayi)]|nr:hypothetical protein [Candidatus Thiodiazotropha sp. (ex Monitilora ramsayi)]
MPQRLVILISHLVLVLALSLLPAVLMADTNRNHDSHTDEPEEIIEENARQGPFDGYDKDKALIWVDDKLYQIEGNLKVVGTPSKIGLLSNIQQGETVKIIIEDRGPMKLPVVIELHRK